MCICFYSLPNWPRRLSCLLHGKIMRRWRVFIPQTLLHPMHLVNLPIANLWYFFYIGSGSEDNKIKTRSLCASVTDHETDEGRFQKCVAKAKYIILFEVFWRRCQKKENEYWRFKHPWNKEIKKKKASRKCSCFLNKKNWPFRKRCYRNCSCGNKPRSCFLLPFYGLEKIWGNDIIHSLKPQTGF